VISRGWLVQVACGREAFASSGQPMDGTHPPTRPGPWRGERLDRGLLH
jgi:hypothetical protein